MNRMFLPGFFFIGTILLSIVYFNGEMKKREAASQPTSSGKVPYSRVHQYQKETAIKIDIEQGKARLRKESAKGHLAPDNTTDEDYTEYTPEKNIGADVMKSRSIKQAITLDQKMDMFLAKKQRFEELEQIQKKAYVEAFIREAYEMGYIVEIDSNMQIKTVKKID